MQGLGPEHQIDEGRPLPQGLALLAGDTAADTDHQVRPLLLEGPPAPQGGKDLLLGLLADRAGIQQQDIRLLRAGNQFQAMGLPQHVRHARGIVLVHLAAVGLDIKLLHHERQNRGKGRQNPASAMVG